MHIVGTQPSVFGTSYLCSALAASLGKLYTCSLDGVAKCLDLETLALETLFEGAESMRSLSVCEINETRCFRVPGPGHMRASVLHSEREFLNLRSRLPACDPISHGRRAPMQLLVPPSAAFNSAHLHKCCETQTRAGGTGSITAATAARGAIASAGPATATAAETPAGGAATASVTRKHAPPIFKYLFHE